jgi:hypothetical protein
MNSPRDAADIVFRRKDLVSDAAENRCDTQSDFERYLKLINTLQTFFAHTYRERRLLAGGLNLEQEKDTRSLQSFAVLDQNKTQLIYDQGTRTYNLYSIAPDAKIAFCLSEGGAAAERGAAGYAVIAAGSSAPADKRNCFRSVVDLPGEDSTHPPVIESPLAFAGPRSVAQPSRYCGIYNRFVGPQPNASADGYPKLELRLHIRSVGEIFQFLGDLLHYQDRIKQHREQNPQAPIRMNTPITFGYCTDNPEQGCDDIFLRLDAGFCNARFSLYYRNKVYHVANYDSDGGWACSPQNATGKDHTLEILAVLQQLVGLHRSATDIRSTPAVQVLP